MEQENYIVYVHVDERGCINEINSSAFLTDISNWKAIDEGTTDKHHHAQGNYFEGGLFTMDGIPLYKWDGTQVLQRTLEEIEADRADIPVPEPVPSQAERLAALESGKADKSDVDAITAAIERGLSL